MTYPIVFRIVLENIHQLKSTAEFVINQALSNTVTTFCRPHVLLKLRMTFNITTEDFERYRLNVEVRDEGTVQLILDSHSGASTQQTWIRRRPLGQGAFGEVWQERWEDKHGDWHYRAVKTCSERRMRAARVDYKRELSALAAFSKSEVKMIIILYYPC